MSSRVEILFSLTAIVDDGFEDGFCSDWTERTGSCALYRPPFDVRCVPCREVVLATGDVLFLFPLRGFRVDARSVGFVVFHMVFGLMCLLSLTDGIRYAEP